ncbi:hypothetical protein [Marinobacter similis]|uniref:Uncharacterized protein n=1 Tax=Marinobacter similis TaxID=1420916 RepID=W5YME2_9GAMM|nr:hypothetical protein [Marinobacter similis]AHI30079.1 hypothetical protein AU14_10210 [Marinobacter similis]
MAVFVHEGGRDGFAICSDGRRAEGDRLFQIGQGGDVVLEDDACEQDDDQGGECYGFDG